jgi:Rrf2 family protein
MKITREADYALRIVAMLAKSGNQMEAKTIAERNGVPYRFTLKILRKIVRAGYLKSYRGANGGYTLNVSPEEITLRNVIEVIDGPIALNLCASGCCNSESCKIGNSLAKIQHKLTDQLDGVTFKDIIEE